LKHFCTISTKSHLFKTKALADSLCKFNAHLHVLIVDAEDIETKQVNVSYYSLNCIKSEIGMALISKYRKHPDKLRWSLKSVFMALILEQTDKIIYVDNDIWFYKDPGFLFELLNTNDVLLTPHFYDTNPKQNQNWLEANFKVGLYNAGFIGANNNAINALNWWSEACLYNIKKSYWRGLFDDQKYLDLLPIMFDKVMVLKHRGCNLAGWNYLWYKLDRAKDNAALIENKYPLIFIHFAETSLIHFSNNDNFFNLEYNNYLENLKKYNPNYSSKRSYFKTYTISVYINYIKWKICRLLES
jgi:hypothetical protein